MDPIKRLNLDFLNRLVISFDDEVTALNQKQSGRSMDEKFYTSIEDETFATLAARMIKHDNDFVFDKTYVNPLFLRQNTTATLLDTIRNEEFVQRRRRDSSGDQFADARRKMDQFISKQRSQREEEKLREFETAIAEYRWLYRPKLISPFLKTFVQDCIIVENVLAKFVDTVHSTGVRASGVCNLSDCIYGASLKDFLADTEKQQYFNKLFLPAVYNFPKRLNTSYVFNKYMHQFFPENVEIADGADTIHSLFLNTVKFKNLNGTQTVSNFINSSCDVVISNNDVEECSEQDVDQAVRRLKKTQCLTVLYLIMKSRSPTLKLMRAERGKISSITNEFILKANTMYYNERFRFVVRLFSERAKTSLLIQCHRNVSTRYWQ